MLLGLGLGGTVLVSGLLNPRAWGEAFLIVAAGYGTYLGLRRIHPRLPRWGFDWAVVSLLVAATGIAGLATLGWL